jgi:hypothetical protein
MISPPKEFHKVDEPTIGKAHPSELKWSLPADLKNSTMFHYHCHGY